MSSTRATVVSDLLRVLKILLDTTASSSATDREDMKPYWKLEKRPHLSILSIS